MEFNVPTLVVQVANFMILLVVLKMVLYEPMVAAITEREARVKKTLDDADAVNAEARSLKEQYEAKLRDARGEATAILQQATAEGERLKGALVAEGQAEKQRIIDKGHQEVARDRTEAEVQLRGRVVTLSVDMASQLFKDTLEPEQHRLLIDQFLKKAGRAHAG